MNISKIKSSNNNNQAESKKDISNINDSISSDKTQEVDQAESPSPLPTGGDENQDSPSRDQNKVDDTTIIDLDIDKLLELIGKIFASLEDPGNEAKDL